MRLKAWKVGHTPLSTSLSGSASYTGCIASELTANTWALLLNIYLQSPLPPDIIIKVFFFILNQ